MNVAKRPIGWVIPLLLGAVATCWGDAGGCVSATCHTALNPASENSHPLGEDGTCETCHLPQGSAHPSTTSPEFSLTGESMPQHCLGCHEPFARRLRSAQSVHRPAREGQCTACHDVHDRYWPYKWRWAQGYGYATMARYPFEMCWQCHPRDLVNSADPLGVTKFRDGTRNLHRAHISPPPEPGVGRRGTSCKGCHDPHASIQASLVPESVPFGKAWTLPIHYTQTANGGACRVGCHLPRSYTRE